jgi:hypothetical protein
MKIAMKLLVLLVLAMAGLSISPATAQVSEPVPEFVMTRPASEYCEFAIKLPPASGEVAENRLFDFMQAASAYTNGWKTTFAVVGVDHGDGTAFNLISFANCRASAKTLDFVADFSDRWQKLYCQRECQQAKPRIASHPKLDFAIRYEDYTFKSQVDEFLHYRQNGDLGRCIVKVELPPAMAMDFPHTKLFGAIMELQTKFRYPIMDVSQIDRSVYILFSRQCSYKEGLYAKMLRDLNHLGFDVGALRSVDFRPDVSDYLFSQTGHR